MAETPKYEHGFLEINSRLSDLVSANCAMLEREIGGVSPAIAKVSHAFAANIERLSSLVDFPISMFMDGQADGERWALACFNVLGKVPFPESDHARCMEVHNRYDELKKSGSSALSSVCLPSAEYGAIYLSGDRHMGSAMNMVGHTLLTGSWTALESVAVDLWVAAVNQRPMTLGRKAWSARGWNDGDEGPSEQTREKDVPIPLLVDNNFNLSSVMGTIIHRKQKFNFNRLRGIREAYGSTFDSTASNLFAGPDLLTLELIRNLIVHKAGIVDQVFLTEGIKAKIPEGQQDGKPLRLDSFQVSKLVGFGISTGISLIRFVGKWLDSKPM